MKAESRPPRYTPPTPDKSAYEAWKKSPAGLSALGFGSIGPVKGGAEAIAEARKPGAKSK